MGGLFFIIKLVQRVPKLREAGGYVVPGAPDSRAFEGARLVGQPRLSKGLGMAFHHMGMRGHLR
jgi:hypothetical protein